MALMNEKLRVMKRMIFDQKLLQQQEQKIREHRKHLDAKPIQVGDLVMIHRPLRGALSTSRKNVSRPWVGPAKVVGIPSNARYLVSDLTGEMIPVLLRRKEIKLYSARLLDKDLTVLQSHDEVLEALRGLQHNNDI